MWKNRLSDLLAQQQFVHFWLARLIVTTVNQLLMMAVAWQMCDIALNAWALGRVGPYPFVLALLMTLPAGFSRCWRKATTWFSAVYRLVSCFERKLA